jgi:hypothetical protein
MTTTRFPAAGTDLDGDLHLPSHAHGVVAFAHGRGRSSPSRRRPGHGSRRT